MARFGPGAKAAALFEVSRGISRFGDVFGNLVRERQQEKRDAPFRAIQLQQAEQGVARGEREAVEAERLAGVRREYDEFKKKLASDDELRRLFEEDVKKGIEASKPEFQPIAGQPAFQETEGLPVQGPQEAPQAPPPTLSTEERLGKLEQFAELPTAQAQIKRLEKGVATEEGREFARETQKLGFEEAEERQEAGFGAAAERQKKAQLFTASQNKLQRQAAEKEAAAAEKDAEKGVEFATADKLGKRFDRASGTYVDVRNSYRRVQASVEDPSAAGDLALIFNYMKMLDPTSTVREGEFATAQNSTGVPGRINALYNRILSGKRLANEQRDDFFNRAGKLMQKQVITQQLNIDRFNRLSGRFDVDGTLVTEVIEEDLLALGGKEEEEEEGGLKIGRFNVIEE